MSDIMGVLVVLVAIACMYFAQAKSATQGERRTYSALGGIASTMIAVEAARRGQPGVCVMFAAAALISLISVALHYVKPSKPDA